MRHMLFASLLLGCAAEPQLPPPTNLEIATADSDRLVVGAEHRYTFEWRVDSETDRGPLGESPLHGAVHVAGELALRVHEVDDSGALVGLEIERVDTAAVELLGQDVVADADVLANHELLLRVAPGGEVRSVWLARDTPSITRHVLVGVAAHTDLRIVEGEHLAPASNGLARMQYVHDPDDGSRIERRIAGYTRIDALGGAGVDDPWSFDGHADIRVDARGLPERIDAVEVVALRGQERPLAFASRARFTLARIGETVFAVAPTRREGMLEIDLFAPPDDTEAERELAGRFADGLTTTDMLLTVHAVGLGQRPPRGFLVRARGLLRASPEQARALVPIYERAKDRAARGFVLDVLTAAQTEPAQRLMVELLEGSLDREPAELPRLVQHTALVEAPIPELAAFVLAAHERAFVAGDDALRRASAYPLGALAGRIALTDAALAERMLRPLRDALAAATDPDDRAAVIAGLGNAGMPEDLERIRTLVDDPDARVRGDVINALRHHRSTASDDVLFVALRDPSRSVAATALATIADHRGEPEHLSRLASATIAGWHHPELVAEIAALLASRDSADELVRGALASLWPRAHDAGTRAAIQRALASTAG